MCSLKNQVSLLLIKNSSSYSTCCPKATTTNHLAVSSILFFLIHVFLNKILLVLCLDSFKLVIICWFFTIKGENLSLLLTYLQHTHIHTLTHSLCLSISLYVSLSLSSLPSKGVTVSSLGKLVLNFCIMIIVEPLFRAGSPGVL